MQSQEGMVPGSVSLKEDTHITGMIGGDVTVEKGVEALIDGVIGGDLIVEEGGRAVIHGIVSGHLIEHGGQIENHGIVGWARG